jgi:probable phosphoglycerate mutase
MASSDKLRLLLIRHGRVDFGSRDFSDTGRGPQWDPPLDERGREQARRVAVRLLAMERPAGVFVSPFRRCRETVRPYLDQATLEAEVVPELGEVFTGEWEGKRFEEIVAGNEELARKFRDQEASFGLAPGGETGAELRARVIPAVEAIIERFAAGDARNVVVVTHGGVINAYLGHVAGIPHDMFYVPENTSINTVWIDGRRRDLRFLNDAWHLTEPSADTAPAGSEAGTASGASGAGGRTGKPGRGKAPQRAEGPVAAGPS